MSMYDILAKMAALGKTDEVINESAAVQEKDAITEAAEKLEKKFKDWEAEAEPRKPTEKEKEEDAELKAKAKGNKKTLQKIASAFAKKKVDEATAGGSLDELKKQAKEVSDKIDKIVKDGGKVSETDPLSVKLKKLRAKIKQAKDKKVTESDDAEWTTGTGGRAVRKGNVTRHYAGKGVYGGDKPYKHGDVEDDNDEEDNKPQAEPTAPKKRGRPKKVREAALREKAVSKAQQQAAAIAMHAPKSKLKGASKEMSKMPKAELEKFAKTKHKGLPTHVKESRESIAEGLSLDAIAHRYGKEMRDFAETGALDEDLYHALYDYYFDDMPYGVKKARTGDPYEWISDRLDDEIRSGEIEIKESNLTAPDSGIVVAEEPVEYMDTPMENFDDLNELARLAGLTVTEGDVVPFPRKKEIGTEKIIAHLQRKHPGAEIKQDQFDKKLFHATESDGIDEETHTYAFNPDTQKLRYMGTTSVEESVSRVGPAAKLREEAFKKHYKTYLESKGVKVTNEVLEEGWKQQLGALATAATLGLGALGPAPVHAAPPPQQTISAPAKAPVKIEKATKATLQLQKQLNLVKDLYPSAKLPEVPMDGKMGPQTFKAMQKSYDFLSNQLKSPHGAEFAAQQLHKLDKLGTASDVSTGYKDVKGPGVDSYRSWANWYRSADQALPLAKAPATESKKAKPDYLDVDKDGDKKEPMKKALKDKEKSVKENVDECMGSMSPVGGTSSQDNISINANYSSADGRKSVSVTADGEQAEALMQMLKLAGMLPDGGNKEVVARVAVAHGMGAPEEVEVKEEEVEYSNSPDEQYQGTDAIIHQGNDLNREKDQYAGKPRLGDNPMTEDVLALESKLAAEYESIKKK